MTFRKLVFVFFVFIVGCRHERFTAIDLSDYRPYTLNGDGANVELLQAFTTKALCDSVNDIWYADAFLCKLDNGADTIVAYTLCGRVVDFLRPDYNGPKGFRIERIHTSKDHPNKILSTIADSILRRNYRYIVGEIWNVLED